MKNLFFNLEQLGNTTPGGIGRYSRELFQAMSSLTPSNWNLTGLLPHRYSQVEEIPASTTHRKSPFATQLIARAWSKGLMLGRYEGNLYSPSLLSPMNPTVPTGKLVVTVHDAVPWTFPETLTKHGVAWHTAMLKRAHKFADSIVVPTNAVKQELSSLYNFENRIVVIPGASSLQHNELSASEISTLEGLPKNFFLSVGTLEPRKGLTSAILATQISSTYPLVHVGPRGWGHQQLDSSDRQGFFNPELLIELGYVSDSLLSQLYDRALAIVMPSKAEGFGLPLIEAMNFGTPGIISNDAALMEVGGSAVLIADLSQRSFIEQLADHMTTLATNVYIGGQLSAQALKQSRNYSWNKSAQLAWELNTSL